MLLRRIGLVLATVLLLGVGAAPAFANSHPVSSTSSPAPDGSGSTGSGGTEPDPGPDMGGVFAESIRVVVGGVETDAVPPGQEAKLLIDIRNAGGKTLTAAKLHVESPDGIKVVDGDDTLGDVAAGAIKTGEITVVVGQADCQEFVGLAGEVTSGSETFPLKLGVPVACPGPRLFIESFVFTGGDGDGVPEPGEKLTVTVTLRNEGRDPARDIAATLQIAEKDFTIVAGSSRWPDIASRASAANLTPFVVQVADGAKVQSECQGGGFGTGTIVADDQPVSSEPNTGSGTTGQEQPATTASDLPLDGGTVTAEPATKVAPPPPGAEPGGKPGTEPGTEPRTEPGVEPGPEDYGVAFSAILSLTKADGEVALDFSNRVVCALADAEKNLGAPDAVNANAPAATEDQAGIRDSSRTGSRGAAPSTLPIAAVALTALAALSLRFRLLHR